MNKCPMCGSRLIFNENRGELSCENCDECEYAALTEEKTKELFGENCFGDKKERND